MRQELAHACGAFLRGLLRWSIGCSASVACAAISVSDGGQASFGHPIAVPPGVAGMAPNIGLSYVDGGINGPVGVGWSVQGISTVTRCPATRITDGVPKNVTFGPLDKLCLDGQRLIQTDESGSTTAAQNGVGVPVSTQTNDALGLTGTTYREFRTEKDSFARIRAYGIASGTDANSGPSYFKVWTKSGQIYEYGTNPNSNASAQVFAQGTTVVAVWAVSRISDVLGNYIDFKYQQGDVAWGSGPAAGAYSGHEWNIKEIQYTGTSSDAPSNKVVFSYLTRSLVAAPGFDAAEAYQLASKNVSTQRLESIRTYVNSKNPAQLGPGTNAVKVRTYKLAYDSGPTTGRSRLTSIKECAGEAESACLPETTVTYTGGGAPDFSAVAAFASGPLGTTKMLDSTTGNFGVLTGDFDGDGRTDILRWGNTPADNVLYLSQGNGAFQAAAPFNLKLQNLFTSDGCYYSIVADFNGDGRSDILRVAKTSCAAASNVLFLSNGDGSFSTVSVPSSIKLDQSTAIMLFRSAPCIPQSLMPVPKQTHSALPPVDDFGTRMGVPEVQGGAKPQAGQAGNCVEYSSGGGKRFYILDVNGDGIPDIVTAMFPAYLWNSAWGNVPPYSAMCVQFSPDPCTRVFLGSPSGTFGETSTNVAMSILYSDPNPSTANSNPYWRLPNQADIDGDGLTDILAKYTGRWRSTGDGNFTGSQIQDTSQWCGLPIDFNGDRRSDCLRADNVAANQAMTLSLGASSSPALAQFNLKSAGNELYGVDASNRQNIGVVIEDFDGDGRQDILRYGPAAGDNGIYLSNGDGSFRTRAPAGLSGLSKPLRSADGSTAFVLGDFLGNGSVQILHMKNNPIAGGEVNQLYARTYGGEPPDLLSKVTSPTGLASQVVTRVPLPNTARYIRETGTPPNSTPAVIDVTTPMYVITTSSRDTTGGTLNTEYLYKGLKVERGGRGMLGFHEVRQQNPAPDGSAMTVATQYLQTYPYTGVAAVSQTYLGTVATVGTPLSRSTYSYCDRTSPTAPSVIATPGVSPTPCLTTAKIQRPYVYQSLEEGWDLVTPSLQLPSVTTTNTYNDSGDPLTITVQTTGATAGLPAQTFTKATTNTYYADTTSGDSWIRGRLQKATVQNTVPNNLTNLNTAAGNSPHATERVGSGPPPAPAPLPPGVLSAILQLLLGD